MLPAFWSPQGERKVSVPQVGGSSDCGTPHGAPAVTVFASGEALRDWAARRGRADLVAEVRPGRPSAVIELGRGSPYNGLAVARQGVMDGRTLTLSASMFTPERPSGIGRAPCAMVELPAEWRKGNQVIVQDAAGREIARSTL